MGMYSRYTIETDMPDEVLTLLKTHIADIWGYATDLSVCDVKWYQWREDMQIIGRMLPDAKIIVKREYEEYDQSQIGYFHGNKHEILPIIIAWPKSTIW